jgi:hypothetical protein
MQETAPKLTPNWHQQSTAIKKRRDAAAAILVLPLLHERIAPVTL